MLVIRELSAILVPKTSTSLLWKLIRKEDILSKQRRRNFRFAINFNLVWFGHKDGIILVLKMISDPLRDEVKITPRMWQANLATSSALEKASIE
jgi:hypothetical protein